MGEEKIGELFSKIKFTPKRIVYVPIYKEKQLNIDLNSGIIKNDFFEGKIIKCKVKSVSVNDDSIIYELENLENKEILRYSDYDVINNGVFEEKEQAEIWMNSKISLLNLEKINQLNWILYKTSCDINIILLNKLKGQQK